MRFALCSTRFVDTRPRWQIRWRRGESKVVVQYLRTRGHLATHFGHLLPLVVALQARHLTSKTKQDCLDLCSRTSELLECLERREKAKSGKRKKKKRMRREVPKFGGSPHTIRERARGQEPLGAGLLRTLEPPPGGRTALAVGVHAPGCALERPQMNAATEGSLTSVLGTSRPAYQPTTRERTASTSTSWLKSRPISQTAGPF